MNKHEQIDEIMRNFDFDKVHKVMTLLDWRWANFPIPHVPTMEEIKTFAAQLLVDGPECGYLGCGGFVARSRGGYLSLEFVIADWFVERLSDEPN